MRKTKPTKTIFKRLKACILALGLIFLNSCQNNPDEEAFNELRAIAKSSLTYGDLYMEVYSKMYSKSMPDTKETPLQKGVNLMTQELEKSDKFIENNLSKLDNAKAEEVKKCYKSLAEYYSKYVETNIAVFRYVKYNNEKDSSYWTETDISNASYGIKNTWSDTNKIRGEMLKNCNL
jgi:hypothetical protein